MSLNRDRHRVARFNAGGATASILIEALLCFLVRGIVEYPLQQGRAEPFGHLMRETVLPRSGFAFLITADAPKWNRGI